MATASWARCSSPASAHSLAASPDTESRPSQARKLGLEPGQRVGIDRRPTGWALADPLFDLVYVRAPASADVIVAFFTRAKELESRLPALAERIHPDGALWVAWPRRAAGHGSDITDNVVREHALPLGIVDVKVAAIDADWSGLRFVWRVANRRKNAVRR
jgi:hypothetical protein